MNETFLTILIAALPFFVICFVAYIILKMIKSRKQMEKEVNEG